MQCRDDDDRDVPEKRTKTIVRSCSVDPLKNCCNYLITRSIVKFPIPCRSLSQRRSFDIYIYI